MCCSDASLFRSQILIDPSPPADRFAKLGRQHLAVAERKIEGTSMSDVLAGILATQTWMCPKVQLPSEEDRIQQHAVVEAGIGHAFTSMWRRA